jgi:hypothetical protein
MLVAWRERRVYRASGHIPPEEINISTANELGALHVEV